MGCYFRSELYTPRISSNPRYKGPSIQRNLRIRALKFRAGDPVFEGVDFELLKTLVLGLKLFFRCECGSR